MQKSKIISVFKRYGDSVVIFRDRTVEPIAVTTDFSLPYIKEHKKFKKAHIFGKSSLIMVWDWTNDTVRVLKAADISKIIPMSSILNNGEQNG